MTISEKNIVEKFNQIQEMDVSTNRNKWEKDEALRDFKRTVERLLEIEARGYALNCELEELEEYRKNFEWETDYSVKYVWELDTSLSTYKGVDSLEELHKHLSEKIAPPTPEELKEEDIYWKDQIDIDLYYATATPSIYLLNFKLREEN